MAFNVDTYTSEEQLGAALQADVSTHSSEENLQEALDTFAPGEVFEVVSKGAYYTIIANVLLANVSLKIVAKGGYFTVILETV